MNRIDQTFKDLKKRKKKAFIAFLTAGDPNLKSTEQLVLAFEQSGVDIIELGVPFSDPLADGPTIQASSQRALSKNINLSKILQLVKRLRQKTQMPVTLMTYYNPIFHYGEQNFVAQAQKSGVDGLIIPDLPPEEAKDLMKACRKHQLSIVFFLSPTTTRQRMKKIIKASSGFIYYVSLTGVTGARQQLPKSFVRQVRSAKRLTKKPICVGFGVSTAAHVRSVAKVSDGVIVGSAIVGKINHFKNNKNMVKHVARYVASLSL